MAGFSKMRSYDNLLKFLHRNKVENPGCVSQLLFDKFVNTPYPTRFQMIRAEDARQKKILPSVSHSTFSSWRLEMKNKGILVCMAASDDYYQSVANYKASQFKFGPSVKKYIEAALHERASVFERIDSVNEKLDSKVDYVQMAGQLALKADIEDLDTLEKRMQEKIAQRATLQEVGDLKLKLLDLECRFEEFMLYVMPPDDATRRQIIKENPYNKEECIRLLKADAEKRFT